MRIGPSLIHHVDDVQQRTQSEGNGQHDETTADIAYNGDGCFRKARNGIYSNRQHQCRHDVGQPTNDAEVLQLSFASAAQYFVQTAHQDALDHPVGQPRRKYQRRAGDQRLQFGMLAQPFQPDLHFFLHRAAPSVGVGPQPRARGCSSQRMNSRLIERNRSVPACSIHSKATISRETMLAPACCMRARPSALSLARREPTASSTTNT